MQTAVTLKIQYSSLQAEVKLDDVFFTALMETITQGRACFHYLAPQLLKTE